jgi:hypothetical protein
MLPMGVPVLCVLCGKGLVADDQQILGILLLGRLGEVEASRDDELAIDDDDVG